MVSCTPKVPHEAEIVILSYNDLHGDFENLPKLSALVRETRAMHKNVIVASAGDRFTGNPYNDYHEKSQFPIIDLENHIGVDIAVIGNHEFDFGVELLNERLKEAKSIAISANIKLEGSGLVGIKPYHIFKKHGIKVAFLGLTEVDSLTGKPSTLLERVADIEFFDPIKTAVNYRFLRKKSHVFVALTHIGLREDLILADSMPELDLIIGGHSHTLLKEPEIQNGVLITHAGSRARHVGKTTILLKKGVVSQITNEMIDLATWEGAVDSVIVEKIKNYENNPFLKEPFVTLQYEIPNHKQLGHMVADAALVLPGVDFSVVNCSSIRTDRLNAGPITYADILRVYPFNNYLVIAALKPSEIRKLIEMEFTDKRNCLMLPAGFEYVAQRTPGDNIKVVKMTYPNGRKLDENKIYHVAVNNYLFTKYLLPEHLATLNVDMSVLDNIVNFLRNNPNMDYRNVPTRAKFN